MDVGGTAGPDVTGGDEVRAETYREAARAAVGELDEIESVVLALEARLVKLRSRARTLQALLDVLREVVPDAATRPGPFAPSHAGDGVGVALPRRRRVRERPGDDLDDLSVRLGVGPRPTGAPAPSADDVLGLTDDGRPRVVGTGAPHDVLGPLAEEARPRA